VSRGQGVGSPTVVNLSFLDRDEDRFPGQNSNQVPFEYIDILLCIDIRIPKMYTDLGFRL
jgi:hypothetical protein